MRLTDTGWSFDSRDLMRAGCDHCTRLSVGRELRLPGLVEILDRFYKPASGLPIRYGNRFEAELESELRTNLGELVQRPEHARHDETIELMRRGVPVIYQGALRGGSAAIAFSGRPDFLLRGDFRFVFGESGLSAVKQDGDPTRYSAWDAKLSSSAKGEYQNQVALYCDVLAAEGMLSESPSGLLLGNRVVSEFEAELLIAELNQPRTKFVTRVLELSSDSGPKSVADLGELVCERGSSCDICEYPDLCQHERERLDHLQLVANITSIQIRKLRENGVHTMAQLAALTPDADGFDERLVRQAAAQLRSTPEEPFVEVISAEQLARIPTPTPQDVFFDIEGFTFSPPGGIEYLLGWVTVDAARPEFFGLWSDDRPTERRNFERFVKFLLKRHRKHPDFKVYHYAAYEKTALKRLAKRYETLETEVAQLLEAGVFIDLYEIVLKSLCVGQPKYSIKNLEHYYSFERSSQVKEAMGSMEYYDAYLAALPTDRRQAKMLKRQVLDYNRDDCVSTLALRDWLLRLAAEQPKP